MVSTGPAGLPASTRSAPGQTRRRRQDGHPKTSPNAWRSFVSKLIIEDLSVPKRRVRVSLSTLRKVLESTGLDVMRNYIRIKLGLRSLEEKDALGQAKRTRAQNSMNPGKNARQEPPKAKRKKLPATRTKKPVLPQNSKSPKSMKTSRRAKKRGTASKARGSVNKTEGAAVSLKSVAKTPRTEKPKRGKPKPTQ
ncbi:histone H1t-like [Sorex fumeus]|uniref:histone H1t-like n=1 Tax=Sorex fumeus TaxID=62283 RepID=UPI0024ADD249|nr:histone H1t-like [Sorex fumeus]